MIKRWLTGLWLLIGLFGITQASDVDRLSKHKRTLTVEWKTYNITDTEPIALYGAKIRQFVDDHWYWGQAGYGAVSGVRGGYLEGGVMGGYQTELSDLFLLDTRLFFGAGGGRSAPQGSGMIAHPTIGLGVKHNPQWHSFFEVGYIKFLNGDIASWTVAFSVNMFYWELQSGG